jgi:hypothetical protein
MPLSLGAYVLPGDPVWLRSSLERYYPFLDRLVVPVPAQGLGWTGQPLRLDECLSVITEVDTRGIVTLIGGRWTDRAHPLDQDTAQRQAAIDALHDVDWIVQIDNDELLPSFETLLNYVEQAHAADIGAVEWPMRVMYRHIRDAYLEVCALDRSPRFDYPGPVAVRAGTRLVEARRASGPFLRVGVRSDTSSLQIVRPAAAGEVRVMTLDLEEAIMHNSWARSSASVWAKTRNWGHASDLRMAAYFGGVWLPAPVTWPGLRNFHPLYRPLWPRLQRTPAPAALLSPREQYLL